MDKFFILILKQYVMWLTDSILGASLELCSNFTKNNQSSNDPPKEDSEDVETESHS